MEKYEKHEKHVRRRSISILLLAVSLYQSVFLSVLAEEVTSASEVSECCSIAKMHGMSWVKSGECSAVLICVHGLGLCSLGYKNFGQCISERGIATYAIDVRGFGPHRKSDEMYRKLDLDATVNDLQQILGELSRRYPGKAIFVLGESMGGSIAIKLASLKPPQLTGMICAAPAWKIYKEKRTTLKVFISWLFGSHKRVSFASNAIMKQATSKEQLRQHWLKDESHRLDLTPSEGFRFRKFVKATPKNARQVDNMPVLIVQGLKDRLVRVSGAAKLYRRIGSEDKTLLLVDGAEHLIFEEGQCDDVVLNALTEWIKAESQAQESISHQQGILVSGVGRSKLADKLFRRAKIEDIRVMEDVVYSYPEQKYSKKAHEVLDAK